MFVFNHKLLYKWLKYIWNPEKWLPVQATLLMLGLSVLLLKYIHSVTNLCVIHLSTGVKHWNKSFKLGQMEVYINVFWTVISKNKSMESLITASDSEGEDKVGQTNTDFVVTSYEGV